MTVLCATLVASGCSDREPILPGVRENANSVFEDVAKDRRVFTNSSLSFAAPRQVSNASWSQGHETEKSRTTHPALAAAPKLIWSSNIGTGDLRRTRITADPVAANGVIYTLDSMSVLTATSSNGATLWSKDLTPFGEASGDADGGGLAIGDNTLFVTTGYGSLFAFDLATGAEKWEQSLLGAGNTRPTYYSDLVYVVSNDTTSWAIEADTGRVRWQTDGLGDSNNLSGSTGPAVSSKYVLFSYGSGEVQAAYRQGGLVTWSTSLAGGSSARAVSAVDDITGAPVIVNGIAYTANGVGRIVAIDIASGDRKWNAPFGARSPLWVASGSVFFVNDESQLMRLNARTGDPIWAVDLPKYVADKPRRRKELWTHHGPVLAGGLLRVASNDGVLRSFDPSSGALVQSVEIPSGATTNPIIVDKTLYVVSKEGQLHAFR